MASGQEAVPGEGSLWEDRLESHFERKLGNREEKPLSFEGPPLQEAEVQLRLRAS